MSKILAFAALAATLSLAAPSAANAFSLGGLVKSAVKTVTHPKTVVRDVGRAADHVVHDVTHPKALVADVKKIKVEKTLKTAGDAVGFVYSKAAKLAENSSVTRPFAPLARDFSRAVRSADGRHAGAAGALVAVATGGVSYAATQAGGWAYAAYAGKREVKQQIRNAKAHARDF